MQNRLKVAIIGGGASGLFLGNFINDGNVALFERGERRGKKLSATGNGQGNISNLACDKQGYFSVYTAGKGYAVQCVKKYGYLSLKNFFASLGVLLTSDERGRVYPAGRQASALTDALRFSVQRKGVEVKLGCKIVKIEQDSEGFVLHSEAEKFYAETIVICAGGKSAKNFGTDGNAYALAQAFSHTITPLYPALVQVKTDTRYIKTLKGIRVSKALVQATWQENGKTRKERVEGDLLFTEYGVSGDAIFRLSAFFADKIQNGVTISINFLPQFTSEEIYRALQTKSQTQADTTFSELLCGIVNNQIGRAIAKYVKEEDLHALASAVQNFPLAVTGSLGFDYAQVTKGGIPLEEVDENLQSKYAKGLYFAGEILDVDGECGGFNLQWAYASARVVAEAINAKGRGQV